MTRNAGATLLDELMPVYDVVERHHALVRAPAAAVYAAIREADLAGGPIASLLMGVRMIPAGAIALLRDPRAALAEWRERRAGRRARHGAMRLRDFERAGFHVIAERPPSELVIGLLGRFWTPRGGLHPTVGEADFRAGPPPGKALAGWNFTVISHGDGTTALATETRVWCAPDARASFRLYWLLVRPGSGLIRREMLRAIRREAERRHMNGVAA